MPPSTIIAAADGLRRADVARILVADRKCGGAARFGLPCVIYMGAKDIERQKPNVFRMRLLGAEVRPATSGRQTLKDAMA